MCSHGYISVISLVAHLLNGILGVQITKIATRFDWDNLNAIAQKLDASRRDSLHSCGYSVAATPLYNNTPLILGINWGGNESSNVQQSEPSVSKWNDADVGSLRNIKRLLHEHLAEDYEFLVQANVSPLRTPTEGKLDEDDLESAATGFLPALVKLVQPKYILFLGTGRLLSVVRRSFGEKLRLEQFELTHARKRWFTYYGSLHLDGRIVRVLVLPHPMARISNSVKIKLWYWVFNQMKGNNT